MKQYNLSVVCWTTLIIMCFSPCESKIDYNGWRLYDIEGFQSIKDVSRFLSKTEIDDNFRFVHLTKDKMEVVISPQVNETNFKKYVEANDLTSHLLSSDVGSLINKRTKSRRRRSIGDSFDRYLPWNEMETYLLQLEKRYPHIIRKDLLGKSYEGRNIYMFTVSSSSKDLECSSSEELHSGNFNFLPNKKRDSRAQLDLFVQLQPNPLGDLVPVRSSQFGYRIRPDRKFRVSPSTSLVTRINNDSNSTHHFLYLKLKPNLDTKETTQPKRTKRVQKPVIFIDGGAHSREWISPAIVMYLLKYLAENPSLSQKIQWQLIPMSNPDGYAYSWKHDRFWRKTRSNTTIENCKGVDINRNFGHWWGKVDTSTFPCAENYGGIQEFSEIETQLLRNQLLKVKSNLKAYLSIHNWGQDILHPYSYGVDDIPETMNELKKVGEGMSEAILNKQRIKYRSGKSSVLLYPASGTAIDWVYDNLNHPLAYLVEVRDQHGHLGFVLPETHIKPTAKDLVAAVTHLGSVIEQDFKDCS